MSKVNKGSKIYELLRKKPSTAVNLHAWPDVLSPNTDYGFKKDAQSDKPINVRQNISTNENETNKKKIVFKDEKEINSFLDSLVTKKDK